MAEIAKKKLSIPMKILLVLMAIGNAFGIFSYPLNKSMKAVYEQAGIPMMSDNLLIATSIISILGLICVIFAFMKKRWAAFGIVLLQATGLITYKFMPEGLKGKYTLIESLIILAIVVIIMFPMLRGDYDKAQESINIES